MPVAIDPADVESETAALAERSGFSVSAVRAMREALVAGRGRMAQFDHPEFGGSGQWMPGMLMIADPGDQALKRRIDALCEALSGGAAHAGSAASPTFQHQSQGAGGAGADEPTRAVAGGAPSWPAEFGAPDASGSQDGMRYAWFARARRLVVERAGRTTIYDTGAHRIGGVSQQQGGGDDLAFTSQHGPVDLGSLTVVPRLQDNYVKASAHTEAEPRARSGHPAPAGDPFAALERLADLHARRVLDDAEYAAKKAELLQRI